MKEKFEAWKPNRLSLERLVKITEIAEKYLGMRIKMTLRQMYYQLVGGGIIPNQQTEYKRLGSLLSKARLAGLFDWDFIEDRVRVPRIIREYDGVADVIEDAIASFVLERWKTQDEYVELWVEKDALSSVLQPITDKYHVPLMINRGYSSTTAMKDAADRFKGQDKPAHILYLGDLDPSGEDMVRDIEERLYTLQARDFNVKKIALNPDQVRKYKLPPNPVKMTDSRHQKFLEDHGEHCYEVDAIPPEELQKIVTSAIIGLMDLDAFNEVIEEEGRLTKVLREATKDIE